MRDFVQIFHVISKLPVEGMWKLLGSDVTKIGHKGSSEYAINPENVANLCSGGPTLFTRVY